MKLLSSVRKVHVAAIAVLFFTVIPLMTLIFTFLETFEERQEKIGLIILGDTKISGWNAAHYNGITTACKKFGVELLLEEKVRENSGQCPVAIKNLVKKGAGMIFMASYSYSQEVQNLIADYSNISFATNSAEVHGKNLTSYFVRMYQARYLSGALAGMKTQSNVIGYVAAMPNTEVNRGINAFTLGVRRINPYATVVVIWTGSWQDEATEAAHAQRLIEEAGADVLTYHQDEAATAQVAERYGVDFIAYNEILHGYSEHYLTSVVCNWDLYYSNMIQRYLKDELNSVKNHWIGIERGAVTLSAYSPTITPLMIKQIDSLKQELINGKLIFSGRIYDTAGQIRCEAGEAISDDTLLEDVNWLVEGVEILE